MTLEFIIIIASLLIVLLLLVIYFYFHLDIGEEVLHQADVIIVTEGPGAERAATSKYLLEQGYSTSGKIIVTAFKNPALNTDFTPIYIGQEKLSKEQIIQENKATTTLTNAIYSLQLMEERGYQSAIVVSTDYHMRRVRWCFDHVNQREGYHFQLTYVSAYPHNKEGGRVHYHQTPKHRRLAREEAVKNIGYRLRLQQLFEERFIRKDDPHK